MIVRNYLKKIILILLVAISFYLILFISTDSPLPIRSGALSDLPRRAVFITQAMNSSLYEKGQLVERVSAARILVRSRRFGLFRLRNINEMVITDLSFDFCVDKNEKNSKSNYSIFSSIKNGFQDTADNVHHSSPFGHITSVAIDGFTFISRKSASHIYLECRAKHGKMKQKSSRLELQDCVLFQPSRKRRIVARKVDWNEEAQRFEILGQYHIIGPSETISGAGLAIDLYFHHVDLKLDENR